MLTKPKRAKDPELLAKYRLLPCVVCGSRPSDPCHIRSRGAMGPDIPNNLAALCRKHHTEQHAIGIFRFTLRYDAFRYYIQQLGWEVGKYRLVAPF